MRLFVAAELPDVLLDALSETSAQLRMSVSGRYVGLDSLHVTLAFLGEVPGLLINEVAGIVERACFDHEPFETSLAALGIFGSASDSVLWQGFDRGREAWDALAQDVRDELRKGGFAIDEKGFIPHVTLMRRADLSGGVLPMPCVERGTIDTVTLFSSDLSGERPSYEPLARIRLG